MLRLLHLCDSLFPIGGFAYSDGLEAATASGAVANADGLRAWLEVVLEETIGRMEGPTAWRSYTAFDEERWDVLATLDQQAMALRPSSAARRSSRAMGFRLLGTWHTLYPDPRLEHLQTLAGSGAIAPTLPVAFAAACGSADVGRRRTIEAFAYTRLTTTVSAAMRLIPIGQTDAHRLLARLLERVPSLADAIADRDAVPESFCPAMDIASMTQQYLHSRLFRS